MKSTSRHRRFSRAARNTLLGLAILAPTGAFFSCARKQTSTWPSGKAILTPDGKAVLTLADNAAPRQRISIDDDWRFTRGDPEGMTANLTLLQVRRGGRNA